MKKSNARNHHFISQAEQRLNAIDKTARRENQRIYKFDILQRDPPSLEMTNPAGVKIEKNLSSIDLYSLKTLEDGGQHNLEDAFQKYENDITGVTKSLLEKLDNPRSVDFESELIRLYALKLLNTIRNPYAIKRTLEMFRELHGVLPADKVLQPHFKSLDDANRPQVARICAEFKVSEDEYISWLKVIYLLILQPLDQGLNLIEHLIKSLIDNNNVFKDFTIFRYKGELEDVGVLLCDRMIEQYPRKGTQTQMFNLDANSFVLVMLIDIEAQDLIDLPLERRKIDFRQANVAHISYRINNLEMLRTYNKYCVWLANSNVYCASPSPYGVTIKNESFGGS